MSGYKKDSCIHIDVEDMLLLPRPFAAEFTTF